MPKPMKGSDHPTPASPGASGGALAGMGLQFALSILVFLWLGQWIDRKLGTAPLFLIVLVLGGAAASFYSIYRRIMQQQRRDEERSGK